MTSLLVIFALFVMGFLQDILGAYYLRLVTEQRIYSATIVSFIHSLLGWATWFWFMYQFQNPEYIMNMTEALVYCIGATIGTFLGLRKPGEPLFSSKKLKERTLTHVECCHCSTAPEQTQTTAMIIAAKVVSPKVKELSHKYMCN